VRAGPDLLVDFGSDCQAYMDRTMRGLSLSHVECDEIWTFVGKKQARLARISHSA
jgi:hypothetical protein